MAFPSEYLKKAIAVLVMREDKLRPENLLPLAQLCIMYWLGDQVAFSRAFILWLAMHALAGYWLIFTSLIASHHHPDIYHAGDTPRYVLTITDKLILLILNYFQTRYRLGIATN